MVAFTCSEQLEEQPTGILHEEYHWNLVDDPVSKFNSYQEFNDVPSDQISVTSWYGLGGDWINMGLPMYSYVVAKDWKPKNGCEIQDSCDGQSS